MRWLILTMVFLQSMACGDGAESQPSQAAAGDQEASDDVPAISVYQMTQEQRHAAVRNLPAGGLIGVDLRASVEEANSSLGMAEESTKPVHCTVEPPEATAELMAPDQWNQTAPESYKVRLDTTSGPITLAVTRAWSPLGADRFYNMVQSGYLADIAWFRVVPDFVAQGGMHGNPEVNKVWSEATIDDDEVLKSNTRGMVSFATSGKNSRSNQFFINFKENKNLDGMGFSPFAEVVDGMQNVDAIYSAHGESPNQGKVGAQGDAYLCGEFPNLDRIKSASIVD